MLSLNCHVYIDILIRFALEYSSYTRSDQFRRRTLFYSVASLYVWVDTEMELSVIILSYLVSCVESHRLRGGRVQLGPTRGRYERCHFFSNEIQPLNKPLIVFISANGWCRTKKAHKLCPSLVTLMCGHVQRTVLRERFHLRAVH